MTEFVFLYTTLPDAETAGRLAETLVAERLAACCNIAAPMTSVYRWQGKIARDSETALWIKTRAALVAAAAARLRALHPYQVPCLLELPIAGGNAEYLAWARAETEPAP